MVENGQGIPFKQSADGLTIQMTPSVTQGISDQQLAKGFKVIRITHDKAWFNDDDPGVRTFGWDRRCKTNQGDFNNDLSFSTQTGDTWTTTITGSKVSVVAPQGLFQGMMEIRIDGKSVGKVAFEKSENVKPQTIVYTSKKLQKGTHEIQLINQGGTIALDALVIQ